ncbi:hypothetical protein E3T55_13455 [Cryobacterium frigoriphilum]|uniref:Uncharacterized protein n=1 Tax=Cryobacterium frigoriphilum TaxID=1259150 RepID=A0A4R8ZXY5_9MICO|nr:hypothetical protein [Cryobacterium frigoriphilum]TFD48487.1 hypothetical protein E3T55_13455 [Cryobacterium frigoriphilum]
MSPTFDDLDGLLDRSAPRTTVMTDSVADELTRLRVATRVETASVTLRRPWRRPVFAGLASVLLLGGAATATAAVTNSWVPWAQTPVTSMAYTLPSGAECEERIGNVRGQDPAAVEAVENFYRTTDIESLLTKEKIASTIEWIRQDSNIAISADGSTEPAGYGTVHYNADEEYQRAVTMIVTAAVSTELANQGIDGADSNLSSDGQSFCPGASW